VRNVSAQINPGGNGAWTGYAKPLLLVLADAVCMWLLLQASTSSQSPPGDMIFLTHFKKSARPKAACAGSLQQPSQHAIRPTPQLSVPIVHKMTSHSIDSHWGVSYTDNRASLLRIFCNVTCPWHIESNVIGGVVHGIHPECYHILVVGGVWPRIYIFHQHTHLEGERDKRERDKLCDQCRAPSRRREGAISKGRRMIKNKTKKLRAGHIQPYMSESKCPLWSPQVYISRDMLCGIGVTQVVLQGNVDQ
jgi:hypothetical protein